MNYKLGFILSFLLLLSACKEDPAPTGANLLPDDDAVDVVRFDSNTDEGLVTTSSYFKALNSESASVLWLGEAPEYKSEIVMRWYNFSEPIGEAGTILEAKMVLYTGHDVFGGTPGTIAFDVQQITEEVSIGDVTSENIGSITTNPTPAGTYTGADSVITVPLDTAMVREWMKKYTTNINATIDDVIVEPFGIKVVPKGMSYIQAINSGNALTNVPELILIVDREGEIDTLRGLSLRDTYAASGPDLTAQPFTVHGGLSVRGRLMFDVSAIPAGSIVNHVRLTFKRNPGNEVRSSLGIDTVLVYEALSTDKDSTNTSSSLCRPTEEDPDVYFAEGTINTATLLLAVQRWVNSPDLNRGLILTKISERSELDQLNFFGGNAQVPDRPRLEVFYTTKP